MNGPLAPCSRVSYIYARQSIQAAASIMTGVAHEDWYVHEALALSREKCEERENVYSRYKQQTVRDRVQSSAIFQKTKNSRLK